MRHKDPLTWGWVQAKSARGCTLGIWALSWCTSALCGAPPPAASGRSPTAAISSISSITLERHCAACPGVTVLVLQRDGHARYTVMGNARQGTADLVASGTVSTRDFEALARLAVQQGFFDLQDLYQDPQLQDGEWATLRIVRGKQDKQVVNRNGAGPPALQTLERGVESLQTRIKFRAEPR